MTLILRIENFDQLENGGPTWLSLDGHGASIGRRASMDWTLPDPSKMISGHHFDIAYQGGHYLLTDVSMNGTFLDGQRHRLEGPLTLTTGQRLIVGHYIIGVEIQQAAAAPPAEAGPTAGVSPAGLPDDGDPWGAFAPASSPAATPGSGAPVTPGAPSAYSGGFDDLAGGFVPVQRPSVPGAGVKTETSLQLPMHTQGPSALPPSTPAAPPNAGPAGGSLQAPGGWPAPQPEAQPHPPATDPYADPYAGSGMIPPAPTPARQPEPPYVPTLGQDAPAPPEPSAPPYTPSLGQDHAPEPDPVVSAPPQAPAYTPSFPLPDEEQAAPPEPSLVPEPDAKAQPGPPDTGPETTSEVGAPPTAAPTAQPTAASVPMPGALPDAFAGAEPSLSPNAAPNPAPDPAPVAAFDETPSIPMPRPAAAQPRAVIEPNPAPAPQPAPPAPVQATSPAPAADAPAAPGGDVSAALRAFCEGAGLDPNTLRPEDSIRLMHMLGRCVRVGTEEIMAMLKQRADVKNFTRGGVRTMLSANANNPMKFMPDSQQALELMFVAPRDGFMTGAESFEDALKDIRLHQTAVFAALQPALAHTFAGLSPEEIEEACENTGNNLLGGGRTAKQWATYVERWDGKAQAGENGVLDAFLQAFAQAYAQANTRQ